MRAAEVRSGEVVGVGVLQKRQNKQTFCRWAFERVLKTDRGREEQRQLEEPDYIT